MSRVFRKSLLITTLAIAAVAMTGCSSGSQPPSSGNPTDGPQKITIATQTNDKVAMQGVIDAFKKIHPGVDVTLTAADDTSYQTTTRTQLSANNGPDIMYAWGGSGNPMGAAVLAKAGYIKNLSAEAWTSKVPAGFRKITVVNGKPYLIPMTVAGIGAIYNMGALAAVGKTVPTTWNEVLGLCAAAKAHGKVAFALGIATPWNAQLINYALVPTLVYKDDPTFPQQMTAGKATFADSKWKEAFEKNIEMRDAGCFQPAPVGTTYETAMDLVAQGQAIGSVQTQSGIAQLQQRNPKAKYQLNPFPATNTASDTRMAAGAGSLYAVNAKPQNSALTMEFVDFMISPKQSLAYATASGSVPAIPGGNVKIPAAIAPLIKYVNAGKTTPYMDVFWPSARVQLAHLAGVQDVFNGTSTIDQALTQMDNAFKQG